ncbi:hypothetical protein ATN81_19165 [Agrobacterium pusense]|uniref:hypothetical protein n=1 Tax=Agrobacterium pusense TaxID=648995 RepID=UPI00092BC25A|nr:hypothetical protein [Agrobacterium pusense]OJH53509.1 hypothetical protein ATN81_19165 [Agrobacterium pusense]OJH57680.1 hypothetical protein BA725_21065 [Agrobacterium pusense]
MTLIDSTMLADMHARRENGESVADIAARYNVKPMAAYQRLRRTYGLQKQRAFIPANDNNTERMTRMAPHNGGCSTLSGLMPVSLPRVLTAANDNASASEDDLAAGEAVNDYALRGKQVAA